MAHSTFLLFQAALLLGQLTGSAIGGLSSDCSVPTTLPLDNRSHSAPATPLPLLDKTGNFGWQPGMCTFASSASYDAVLKAHHDGIPSGHDTCSGMEHSLFLLFEAALLLGQLTGSAIGGLSTDCPVPTTLPLDNRSQSAPGTPLPILDKTGNFDWQPGMCSLASRLYQAMHRIASE
ncbi:hypothetical protein MTO96_000541 [Rhipicephalus appendiculatus]